MAKTSQKRGRIFTPKDAFIADIDGVDVSFTPVRTRVREGHELLERFPELFEELDVQYEVEQATANPGETR